MISHLSLIPGATVKLKFFVFVFCCLVLELNCGQAWAVARQAPLSMRFSRQQQEWVAISFSSGSQQLNLRLLHCRQIHSDAPLLFSRSVVSNSVTPWTAACQLICPPPSPRACSNPCALTQCHPTISSSVVPFFSCPQSFPASGFFPMSWLFISDGQSIRTSASASVLSMNIQD